MRWLLGLALGGCVVEDVQVLTDGPEDTAAEAEAPKPGRPQVGDEAPSDESTGDLSIDLQPTQMDRGRTTLVFITVQSGTLDMSEAVDIALYGEPDVDLQTWTAAADEIVLSLWAAEGSTTGELTVVVELEDGSVVSADQRLQVL